MKTSLSSLRAEAKAIGCAVSGTKAELIERLNHASRMISKATLKERGWTDASIHSLLGEPDATRKNPYYKRFAPMCLYRTSRVELTESSEGFAAALARKEKSGQAKATIRRRRTENFEAKYSNHLDALPIACEVMFNLNRYTKHKSCTRDHRFEIYELKNRLVELLYRSGNCERCYRHSRTIPEQGCYGCHGSGKHWSGEECRRCDGSGIYGGFLLEFYCFEFFIAGKKYCWHQPRELVSFEVDFIDAPSDWKGPEVQPIAMSKSKFAEGKQLIAWLLDKADPSTDESRKEQGAMAQIS